MRDCDWSAGSEWLRGVSYSWEEEGIFFGRLGNIGGWLLILAERRDGIR